MKSYIVHYRNKYPGAKVESSESGLRVYSAEGDLLVALVKDGSGSLKCVSEEQGALERHDLSPIPREARVHKLCKQTSCIKLDEESKKRVDERKKFMSDEFGYSKVWSCEELEERGFKFDEKGNCLSYPKA